MSSAAELGERLASIRERIARAAQRAGRDPAGVVVLAITKGHPVAAIEDAVAVGLRQVGESRVQEARAKQAQLSGREISWHMIGHLQRNKARAAATMFDTVHSVDGAAVAAALAAGRGPERLPLSVYIEVELTGIPARTGVAPEAAAGLLTELRGLPALAPVGLMTIAPPGPPEAARACFAHLRELRERLRELSGMELGELSMGMSDDYEVAVEEGATVLRLGRALFGSRPGPGP